MYDNGFNKYKIATIVLAVVVIAMSGYIVVDKVNNSKKESNNAELETESLVIENKNDNNDEARYAGMVLDSFVDADFGKIIISKEGDAYVIIGTQATTPLRTAYTYKNFPGTQGNFKFQYSDFDGYNGTPGESGQIDVNGHKLGLRNIVSVARIDYGKQRSADVFAFIDADGNMSVLRLGWHGDAKLNKNVMKNVAYTQVVSSGDGVITLVHYKNGSYSELGADNFKKF